MAAGAAGPALLRLAGLTSGAEVRLALKAGSALLGKTGLKSGGGQGMEKSNMRYFLYARKSTDEADKQVLSIEAQLVELREYANKEGLPIAREFVESKTAKEPGREVFNEMMAKLEQGAADGIVAWHPDRLARNSVYVQ